MWIAHYFFLALNLPTVIIVCFEDGLSTIIMGERNMANYKKWTDAELNYIQNNHNTLSDENLAASLSKISSATISTAMVRRQRRKLSLKKPRGRPLKNKNVESVTATSGEIG
jgi:hypothetical protein